METPRVRIICMVYSLQSLSVYIHALQQIVSLIFLINYFVLILIKFAAIFNKEDDIGTYTIRAVDDPRTLNRILYINPPKNFYSFNELVALWEKKIGKTLEKTYVSEEQLLKDIQGKAYVNDVLRVILRGLNNYII